MFGNVVHSFAANLNFNPLPVVPHQGNVQRLITICLRMTYPVTEAVRMRLVYFGDRDVDIETVVEFLLYVARLKNNTDGQ